MKRNKRILIVSPYLPYPPIHGGAVRIYNLLKNLSNKYDLYLLSLIDNDEQVLHSLHLRKYCRDVYPVKFDRAHSDITSLSWGQKYYSPEFATILNQIIKDNKIDLVQFEFILTAVYAKYITDVPIIFTEHDSSNLSFERSIHNREVDEHARYKDWQNLIQFEREICQYFNRIIVVSKEDKQQLESFLPYKAPISLVPTGVDTRFYKLVNAKTHGSKPCLIYVGHYKHWPNTDAMLYFCSEILPIIKKKVPNVCLYIVGSAPTPEILALHDNRNIVVTGQVPDIRPYLKKADVFIAPLRIGGGIKGKILEAMAMGVPVVSNKLGASGIEAVNEKHIFIEDKPKEFALKTMELLNNKKLHNTIKNNARKLVEKRYIWNVVTKLLDEVYIDTIKGNSKIEFM